MKLLKFTAIFGSLAAVVYWFIIPYWPYILGIGVAVLVAIGVMKIVIKRRRMTKTQAFLKKFGDHLLETVIIDSNIWMNEGYDPFFYVLKRVCREKSYILTLYGPQFEEMCNLKREHDYGHEKNMRARLAVTRIEEFQKEGLLKIHPINIEPTPGIYADPLILRLIIRFINNDIGCTFISDDKELRVRARQLFLDHEKARWEILDVTHLMPECRMTIECQKLISSLACFFPVPLRGIWSQGCRCWSKFFD